MPCCNQTRTKAKKIAVKKATIKSNNAQKYAAKLRAQGLKPKKVAALTSKKFYKPKHEAPLKKGPLKVAPCKMCGKPKTK